MGQSATKSIPIPPTPVADAAAMTQLKQLDPSFYNILAIQQKSTDVIDAFYTANYATDTAKPKDVAAAAIRAYATKYNDYALFAKYRDQICNSTGLTDFVDPFVADPTINTEFKLNRIMDLYCSNLAIIMLQASKTLTNEQFVEKLNEVMSDNVGLLSILAPKIIPNLTDELITFMNIDDNDNNVDDCYYGLVEAENTKRQALKLVTKAAEPVAVEQITPEPIAEQTAAAIELLTAVATDANA